MTYEVNILFLFPIPKTERLSNLPIVTQLVLSDGTLEPASLAPESHINHNPAVLLRMGEI